MPPVVAAAAVTAAATLGGAALQSRSANKANSAQERATREAIALERERDAAKARRYEADMARYDQQYAAWYEARRQGLAQRGINIPALANPAQTSSRGGGARGPTTFAPGLDGKPATTSPWAPGAPGAALPPGATDTGMAQAGGTLGDIAGGGGGGAFNLYDSQQGAGATAAGAMQPPPGGTLGDMVGGVDWADWRNYAPR